MRLVRLFVLPLLVGAAAFAQTTPTPTRPGEDAGETTWTVRYANCESGFYVLLPAGVAWSCREGDESESRLRGESGGSGIDCGLQRERVPTLYRSR
jgi:hypothetical protein